GWHSRVLVRDMLAYRGRRFSDPAERARQARAFLKFMYEAIPDRSSLHARILKEEVDFLGEKGDYYLCHEQLEDNNIPVYFHQFMERAAAQGLQFLGETWQQGRLAHFGPEVRTTLQQLAGDIIELEQYLDFLGNRNF